MPQFLEPVVHFFNTYFPTTFDRLMIGAFALAAIIILVLFVRGFVKGLRARRRASGDANAKGTRSAHLASLLDKLDDKSYLPKDTAGLALALGEIELRRQLDNERHPTFELTKFGGGLLVGLIALSLLLNLGLWYFMYHGHMDQRMLTAELEAKLWDFENDPDPRASWMGGEKEVHPTLALRLYDDFSGTDYRLMALEASLKRIDPDGDGVLGDDDLCPWNMSILNQRQSYTDGRDRDLDRNGCLDDIYWMRPEVAFARYRVEDEDGNPISWPAPQATLRGADTDTATDDDPLWWYWDNVRRIDGKEFKSFGLQCEALRGDDDKLVTLSEMVTAPSTSYGHCAVFEGTPVPVPDRYLKK